MNVFFVAETINVARTFRRIHIHIYLHSWYSKNTNRSQAERLLKTEVNSMIYVLLIERIKANLKL